MTPLDKIRLTGLLRRKPWKRGFLYWARFAGDSTRFRLTGERGGLLGTARPGRPAVRPRGCAGNAPRRTGNDSSTGGRQPRPAGPARLLRRAPPDARSIGRVQPTVSLNEGQRG